MVVAQHAEPLRFLYFRAQTSVRKFSNFKIIELQRNVSLNQRHSSGLSPTLWDWHMTRAPRGSRFFGWHNCHMLVSIELTFDPITF